MFVSVCLVKCVLRLCVYHVELTTYHDFPASCKLFSLSVFFLSSLCSPSLSYFSHAYKNTFKQRRLVHILEIDTPSRVCES